MIRRKAKKFEVRDGELYYKKKLKGMVREKRCKYVYLSMHVYIG